MPPGAIIITAIFTNTSAIFTNTSITFPHLYSAVHSPPLYRWLQNATRAIIVTMIYTNNFAAVITNSLPLYAAV